jgi:hypothetical protein
MSPSVELSPQTFARLQAHAVPLVDSIESVINRIVDYYEAKGGKPVSASERDGSENVRQFTPATPPSLKHTKVLTVEFCGKTLEHSQAKWNGLLVAAVREAKARAKSPSAFKRLVIVNFVDGQKTDEGYRFLSDVGISVQGQDADASWRAACHIAQHLGCQLQVTFAWRQKEGAAFPGTIGQFSIAAR